jgi:hypothetical protein
MNCFARQPDNAPKLRQHATANTAQHAGKGTTTGTPEIRSRMARRSVLVALFCVFHLSIALALFTAAEFQPEAATRNAEAPEVVSPFSVSGRYQFGTSPTAALLETRADVRSQDAAAATFPIPGLSDILKVFMKLLMPPVFDPFMEKMQDHLEHTMSETVGKDVNAATPKDATALLVPDLRRNLTNLLVDTVTAAVTAPLASALTASNAGPSIEAVVAAVDADLSQSLHSALHELLGLRLGKTLATSLFRSLRHHLVPALTTALTHTLVPSLTHALKPVRELEQSESPSGWHPRGPLEVSTAIAQALEACGPALAGRGAQRGQASVVAPASPSDPGECWAALEQTQHYGDLYRSHYASEYYASWHAAFAAAAVQAIDAKQFQLS